MCGIFGHIGTDNSAKICLEGLKFLEYRGYDSSGIAGFEKGNLLWFKEKGKLSELEKRLENKLQSFQSSIGHTRWATHGIASKDNAHPHLDQKKDIAVVHNGIIENYRLLRKLLESKGFIFETDTDTEIIAQLIADCYQGNFVEAVQKAIGMMKGFWGLAIIHKNHPNQIIAACRESPLVVGFSKTHQEGFISSDPQAFMREDIDLFVLKDHELAIVSREGIHIYDEQAKLIERKPDPLEYSKIEMEKGFYDHFMLKEIFEQPNALRNCLKDRIIIDEEKVELDDFLSSEEIGSINNILILGCGSSWHAGCIGAMQFEELTSIPARAEIASEYRYKKAPIHKNTLVIAISQSGETFDTVAAVRKAKSQGARILALSNVSSSTLFREAHHKILLKAGPEMSVCSTKTFSNILCVLSLIALKLGQLNSVSNTKEIKFLQEILQIPVLIEEVLNQKEVISNLAQKYAHLNSFFFVGRQYMALMALEAALKLKEISYLNALGYPAGELKHGPIALIDENSLVIGLCGNENTYEKTLSNLMEVKARKGKILAFAPINSPEIEEIADDVLWLPPSLDIFSPFIYTIPIQLFAYSIAKILGKEIDQPRNLAKSVTVE